MTRQGRLPALVRAVLCVGGLTHAALAENTPPVAPGAEPPRPAPESSASSVPPAGSPPPKLPDYYYPDDGRATEAVEARPPSVPSSPNPGSSPPPPQIIFEPPPPPPPPVAHHIAPNDALWVGLRSGIFSPFGPLWAKSLLTRDGLTVAEGVPWQRYASVGPFFELDAGARLGRNYNVFGLWEHAVLPTGTWASDSKIAQSLGSTDYWALGLRINSNPDRVGFVAEVSIGYRVFVASWEDGTDLTLSDSIMETRVGVGAEIRLGKKASLTPMLTLAAGTFGEAAWDPARPSGVLGDDVGRVDEQASHSSVTLQVAGHLDLLGAE